MAIHDEHWKIEQYHRAIKQVCHIEHSQVRSEKPHIRQYIELRLPLENTNSTGDYDYLSAPTRAV